MSRSSLFIPFLFLCLVNLAWAAKATSDKPYVDEQFVEDERAAIVRMSAAWAASINENNPEKTVSFYANQISVYATFETQIDNYKALLDYFTALSKKPNFQVAFKEKDVRVYGPTAVNSGVYVFSYSEKNETVNIPARFTFVYALGPSGWKIVEHHSSVLPK